MQMYRYAMSSDEVENRVSDYKTYFCPRILSQMHMKKITLLTLIVAVATTWFACKSASTPAAEENSFGAGVSNPDSALAFTVVTAQLETADSANVTLRGKVSDVCQAKGCWMNIVDPTGASTDTMFVQVQDYGFFMPKDLAGKEVIIQGKAYKQETTVEELKHYAEDAGKSAEEIAAITQPVMEKKFMATGVVIAK